VFQFAIFNLEFLYFENIYLGKTFGAVFIFQSQIGQICDSVSKKFHILIFQLNIKKSFVVLYSLSSR